MAVYRPTYRDPKTGETKQQKVWWYNFTFAGRHIQESSKSTRKTIATEAEKKRRRELEKSFNGSASDATIGREHVRAEAVSVAGTRGEKHSNCLLAQSEAHHVGFHCHAVELWGFGSPASGSFAVFEDLRPHRGRHRRALQVLAPWIDQTHPWLFAEPTSDVEPIGRRNYTEATT